MKPYTVSIDINKPRAEVVELFDSSENIFYWQPGLQSFEHSSGEPGQVGARSLLVYQNGKMRIELIETITKVDLPDEFNGTYEWNKSSNTLENRFIDIDGHTTRWESTCAYNFGSLPEKLMGVLVPWVFRKQNMGFLKNFKAFCEQGWDVRVKGPVK